MDNLQLHLGILQRIVFCILRFAYFIQNGIISATYWRIVGNTLTYIAWVIWGDSSEGTRTIQFFKEKRLSYCYGTILHWVIIINGWLNGRKAPYTSYQFLLTWNPTIPLIAIKGKKRVYSIHWLGEERIDREGLYPLIDARLLGASETQGYFAITNKYPKAGEPSSVSIDCVWLSGENIGEKFTINQHGLSGGERNQKQPETIYFPPRIVVWLFEIIVSVGALTALVGAVWHIWEFLSKQFIGM